MPAHCGAVGIDDVAGALAEALGQPFAGVPIGDETDVVAVGLGRDVEPARSRLLADLRLGGIPKGEKGTCQLMGIKHSQDVGLVLAHIHGTVQFCHTRATLHDLGVVAGSHSVEPQSQSLVKESGELDLLVATQTGVRCATSGVLRDEVVHHVLLETRGHVPDVEGDPDHVSHPAGIAGVLDRATAARALTQGGGVLAQRKMNTDHLVAGLNHARGGDRRVDAPAHRGNHTHQRVCLGLVATCALCARSTAAGKAARNASTSAAVEVCPRVSRRAPRAVCSDIPIANRTWLGCGTPA